MSSNTSIEWTEATWNCLAGCSEISPGCTFCYAAVMAHRLAAMGQKKYIGTTKKLPNGKIVWTGKINIDEEALSIPLKRKKPTTYFVNSMSDLFHEDVPDEFIDRVFGVMAATPHHTYQILTKRAERLSSYMNSSAREGGRWDRLLYDGDFPFPDHDSADIAYDRLTEDVELKNVWLGVSVENQEQANKRIPILLRTPAAVRFLSCEPLLGPVDFGRAVGCDPTSIACEDHQYCRPLDIHWVIVGCESGHKRRPMQTEWATSIREQCQAAGVSFFMKQMEIGGKVSGEIDQFPASLRVREFPKTEAAAR